MILQATEEVTFSAFASGEIEDTTPPEGLCSNLLPVDDYRRITTGDRCLDDGLSADGGAGPGEDCNGLPSLPVTAVGVTVPTPVTMENVTVTPGTGVTPSLPTTVAVTTLVPAGAKRAGGAAVRAAIRLPVTAAACRVMMAASDGTGYGGCDDILNAQRGSKGTRRVDRQRLAARIGHPIVERREGSAARVRHEHEAHLLSRHGGCRSRS